MYCTSLFYIFSQHYKLNISYHRYYVQDYSFVEVEYFGMNVINYFESFKDGELQFLFYWMHSVEVFYHFDKDGLDGNGDYKKRNLFCN